MYEGTAISLQIQRREIIQDANLSVRPGSFVAIVGPNGSGKSSLLKVLSNEYAHYSGHVIVNGKPLKTYKPKVLSRLRAVMPQFSSVQFAFSVLDILMLGRHAHDTTKNENVRVVEEVSILTGITELLQRNYLSLSGGEKQRVHFSRVLCQVWEETVYPRYLLLDEPTASMDIAHQQHIFGLTKKVQQRNIGVLAIMHDLNQAVQYADDIYFMRKGRIVAAGSAREVFTKSIIEETFKCTVDFYNDPYNKCPYIIPRHANAAQHPHPNLKLVNHE